MERMPISDGHEQEWPPRHVDDAPNLGERIDGVIGAIRALETAVDALHDAIDRVDSSTPYVTISIAPALAVGRGAMTLLLGAARPMRVSARLLGDQPSCARLHVAVSLSASTEALSPKVQP